MPSDWVKTLPRKLPCGNCGIIFDLTLRQAKSHRYEGKTIYCSPLCKKAAYRVLHPRPQYGPCPTCKKMFESRVPKKFCSMACYMASPDAMFKKYRYVPPSGKDNPLFKSEIRNCLECGKEFEVKPAKTKRFCCKLHYRQYMAKRFDRWIASPQHIGMPQNYDEFLTQAELPCIIEGCDWSGRHLAGHVQLAHGMLAKDLKRAAGFNLSTGLVSPDLKETLVLQNAGKGNDLPVKGSSSVGRYRSREGQEHRRKSLIIRLETGGPGPARICQGCGGEFHQKHNFGYAKFCSVRCRSKHYKSNWTNPEIPTDGICAICGTEFRLNYSQGLRFKKGKKVFCSIQHRQAAAGRVRHHTVAPTR